MSHINWQSNGTEAKAYNKVIDDNAVAEISTLLTTLDVTKISGSIGTIHPPGHKTSDTEGWRVDLQSPSTDAYNVQVQKNGASNPSTAGCVMVPMRFISGIGSTSGGGKDVALARASELRRAVHGALVRSARTQQVKTNQGGRNVQGEYVITVQKIVGQFSCG